LEHTTVTRSSDSLQWNRIYRVQVRLVVA